MDALTVLYLKTRPIPRATTRSDGGAVDIDASGKNDGKGKENEKGLFEGALKEEKQRKNWKAGSAEGEKEAKIS